jgi:hypothetical protein
MRKSLAVALIAVALMGGAVAAAALQTKFPVADCVGCG